MRILEATAGGRSYWHDKQHPETVFMDLRLEKESGFIWEGYDVENSKKPSKGNYTVLPHLQADYRNLPFANRTFDLVVFDPPHLVTNNGMKKLHGIMKRKYGALHAETWQNDMRLAFNELFRVMKDTASLNFKFCDYHIGFQEILDVIPQEPLYGTTVRSGHHETRWLAFNKPMSMRSYNESA